MPKVVSTKKPPASKSLHIVDSKLWRASRLSGLERICASLSLKLYRLKRKELSGLTFEKSETVAKVNGEDSIVPLHLYREQDVEWLAWEKRGGPDAFEAYLLKRRATYLKRYPGKEFPAPFDFVRNVAPDEGGVTVAQVQAIVDPRVRTAGLHRLKDLFAKKGLSWLWGSAANSLVDPRDNLDDVAKENALRRFLAKASYPPHPTIAPPDSPSLSQLRCVVRQGPHYVERDQESHEPNPHWRREYLDRVFAALISVIENDGIGSNGWEFARWEVYYCYSHCFGGTVMYHGAELGIFDEGKDWLVGWVSPSALLDVRRDRQTNLGREYNAMLPGAPVVG
ncbi:hypothetical protein C8R43DRAFT_986391 [Mycena crocata]|nr:hypothetical protein C8R43DRAFT_986391 [Mycena crocata]